MPITIENAPNLSTSWLTKRFQRLTALPSDEDNEGSSLSLSSAIAARVKSEAGPRPTGELSTAIAEEIAHKTANQITTLGGGAVAAQARFNRDSVMQLLRT